MPVFGVRLSDDLARRFDRVAAQSGGRAALMRKLIDEAVGGAGEGGTDVPARTRRPHRLEIRLDDEDMRLIGAAALERGLTRNGWAAEVVRHRLRVDAPAALPERQAIADAWRQIRRVGLNINQAVHALHAAMMKDSRLDLAREAARVAAMRGDVAEQTRALGKALKGDLSYWRGDGDGGE
ncbi:mobilization protein [Sphingobium sp. BHU LFT2]|uniref:mobilization protein n=1 Tax=Sphingobium sp. BHU LFT2 TaxID=2807634 RepID=UPI001BEAB249|nr:mobilization protein [Sphingobium sp. BHU LFT2]MBT2246253.1 mobilization protein [Sphingobium sp. BHU LFT2]